MLIELAGMPCCGKTSNLQKYSLLFEAEIITNSLIQEELKLTCYSLNQEIKNFTSNNKNAKSYDALGQFLYYNCINIFDCVVGNSSSGLFEVPSFKKPTVNIGDRQKGRIKSNSVIDCEVNKKEILKAISRALSMNCDTIINPYGEGKSAEKIVSLLGTIDIKKIPLQKHLYYNVLEHQRHIGIIKKKVKYFW